MAIDLKAVEFEQPAEFKFTPENFTKAQQVISRYPAGREQSAVMPLLVIAQQQHDGWLPKAAINYVAAVLGMAPMKVYEVASFYTQYNLQPMGYHHIQVCGTTPCWLRGSDEIMAACESKLGIKKGETTADGAFTLSEVECLGACVNAPMLQVTTQQADGYYEDLTPFTTQELLESLARGALPGFGSLAGRTSSEPATGLTSLQGDKKQKPKLKTKITSLEDTGEPSEEALELAAKQLAEEAKKAKKPSDKTSKKDKA